jgi:hypothetical protein
VEPFQLVHDLRSTPVVVLDGLDECANHSVQQTVLRLFINAIRNHQLPIRSLIISRPEPHLREILDTEETRIFCRHSVLAADPAAFEDIKIYLRDEFSRIYSEHTSRGTELGVVWPSLETVEHLAEKSSGTFIYATTVVRFIDDEYSHPLDRLASVLHLDPRSTAPLDDLYTEIISVVPQEPQKLLRLLHAIWQGTVDFDFTTDPEETDMLFDIRPGACRLALRGLHSIFMVPPPRPRFGWLNYIHPLHASLAEYLADERRSGQWCVARQWLQSDYLHCAIRVLSSPSISLITRRFHS